MAGKVTIQDIADALGVSRNTVSKAINNTGILADATRDRVLKKAVEMGYKQFSYVAFSGPAKGRRHAAAAADKPAARRTAPAASQAIAQQTAAQQAATDPQTIAQQTLAQDLQTAAQRTAAQASQTTAQQTEAAVSLAAAQRTVAQASQAAAQRTLAQASQAAHRITATLSQAPAQQTVAQASQAAAQQMASQTPQAPAQQAVSQTPQAPAQQTSAEQQTAGNANTIAMFTTCFLGNSHFSSTMLDRFQTEVSLLGYGFAIYYPTRQNLQQLALPASFTRKTTAGIICFEMFDQAYSEMLCELGLPILFVDAPAPRDQRILKADRLLMENRPNIFALTTEMARRGKTRIGFIGDMFHCLSFYERYMAFREALITLNLPFYPEYSLTENDPGLSPMKYREYLEEQLKEMESLPDVFLCANDFIAADVLNVLTELGWSVPRDVYVCGFDDSPESKLTLPALTTVHIHSQIMGFSAAQLLMSRIREPSLNYRTVYTETTLIYRASTGD